MISLTVLHGKITFQEYKRLYSHGQLSSYMFMSVQNDREFCDIKINRIDAERIIQTLQELLKKEN